MKTRRPAHRSGDVVTLAAHVRMIPAYDGRPCITRMTLLRVSSVSGRGTLRSPWAVSATDGVHCWHFEADDLVKADVILD